jgi:SAM-dependent methyltransferase
MSAEDRVRWDQRYAGADPTEALGPDLAVLPAVFTPFTDIFPLTGYAIELACGRGQVAVWLARRGLDVVGFDVSPVAITQAGALARACGVSGHCRFEAVDLDNGLPGGPAADVIVCHRFRDARLDQPLLTRLAPSGLLAISALSEVGADPGPFRVKAGELQHAFAALDVIAAGESDGLAWLLGRKPFSRG